MARIFLALCSVLLLASSRAQARVLGPLFQALQAQAGDPPSSASGSEGASQEAGEDFDGTQPRPPVRSSVLSPVEYVDIPQLDEPAPPVQGPPAEPPVQEHPPEGGEPPPPPPPSGEAPPVGEGGEVAVYHMNGRQTKIPTVYVYSPEKDAPGKTSTQAKEAEKGFLDGIMGNMKNIKTGLFILGALATLAGAFLFPPALFLGGLLLGAGAVLSFLPI